MNLAGSNSGDISSLVKSKLAEIKVFCEKTKATAESVIKKMAEEKLSAGKSRGKSKAGKDQAKQGDTNEAIPTYLEFQASTLTRATELIRELHQLYAKKGPASTARDTTYEAIKDSLFVLVSNRAYFPYNYMSNAQQLLTFLSRLEFERLSADQKDVFEQRAAPSTLSTVASEGISGEIREFYVSDFLDHAGEFKTLPDGSAKKKQIQEKILKSADNYIRQLFSTYVMEGFADAAKSKASRSTLLYAMVSSPILFSEAEADQNRRTLDNTLEVCEKNRRKLAWIKRPGIGKDGIAAVYARVLQGEFPKVHACLSSYKSDAEQYIENPDLSRKFNNLVILVGAIHKFVQERLSPLWDSYQLRPVLLDSTLSDKANTSEYNAGLIKHYINNIDEQLPKLLETCFFQLCETRDVLLEQNSWPERDYVTQIDFCFTQCVEILSSTCLYDDIKDPNKALIGRLDARKLISAAVTNSDAVENSDAKQESKHLSVSNDQVQDKASEMNKGAVATEQSAAVVTKPAGKPLASAETSVPVFAASAPDKVSDSKVSSATSAKSAAKSHSASMSVVASSPKSAAQPNAEQPKKSTTANPAVKPHSVSMSGVANSPKSSAQPNAVQPKKSATDRGNNTNSASVSGVSVKSMREKFEAPSGSASPTSRSQASPSQVTSATTALAASLGSPASRAGFNQLPGNSNVGAKTGVAALNVRNPTK